MTEVRVFMGRRSVAYKRLFLVSISDRSWYMVAKLNSELFPTNVLAS